jgi:formylglycine-generating enzyme
MVGAGLLVTLLPLIGCGASSKAELPDRARVRDQGLKVEANLAASRPPAPPPSASTSSSPRDEKSVGFVAAALGSSAAAEEARQRCRAGMVQIDRFCIDRYEASLVEVLPGGEERPFSPFAMVLDHKVRAVSEPNVYPQGYISATQADRACAAAGKRLCRASEWQQACRGPDNKRYGYSDQRESGRCNDNGKNPVVTLFGNRYDATTMNQPQLNQLNGTLARTGDHVGCSNGYGVYDMVGNVHEWVADRGGTFYGGYYQDVASFGHGEGCGYVTTAHEARYHDYSTGFRCCADASGYEAAPPSAPAKKASPPKPNRKRKH